MYFFKHIVAIKGAGEMATGVASSLYRAGFKRIVMLDMAPPLAVRLEVSFCKALATGEHSVEGIRALRVSNTAELFDAWTDRAIGVCDDPSWQMLGSIKPFVLIDATIAKKNLGTALTDAPFVVALGPGFTAGTDAHVVIETQRGHSLGRILYSGCASEDTGLPEAVLGYAAERVLRAPCSGLVMPLRQIGETIEQGDTVMQVDGQPVIAPISGVLRGCISSGVTVREQCKIGDIDPRNNVEYCFTISDKARSLGGAVLTALMAWVYTRT